MNVVGVCTDKEIDDRLWRHEDLVYTHLIAAWSGIPGHWTIGMEMRLHTSHMSFNRAKFR